MYEITVTSEGAELCEDHFDPVCFKDDAIELATNQINDEIIRILIDSQLVDGNNNEREWIFKLIHMRFCIFKCKGLHQSALNSLKLLNKVSPLNPIGYLLRGEEALERNDEATALEMFLKAIELSQDPGYNYILKTIDSAMKKMKRKDPFELLPNEIMHQIFSHLTIREWTVLQRVCKKWQDYLTTDYSLWSSSISFNSVSCFSINGSALQRCLACATDPSKQVQTIHYLNTAFFPSLEEQTKCLNLLAKDHQPDSVAINTLVMNLTYNNGDVPFDNMIPIKNLEISGYNYPYCIDKMLASNVYFETLNVRFHLYTLYDLNSKIEQNFTLKSLTINSSHFSNNLLLICIRACPNLESLTFSEYVDKISPASLEDDDFLDIDALVRETQDSKVKSLSLKRSSNARRNPNSLNLPGSWSNSILSLKLDIIWFEYSLVSGVLDNLRFLKLGYWLKPVEFFKSFRVGAQLESLAFTMHEGYGDDISPIWKSCPNLKFTEIILELNADGYVSSILDHCPKLEAINITCRRLSDRTLISLSKKKGLKSIGASLFSISEESHAKILENGVQIRWTLIPEDYN